MPALSALLLLFSHVIVVASSAPQSPGLTLTLTDWRLASTANVSAPGSVVSSLSFDVSGWYNASLPCTVVACLLQNGLFPNPFFGSNLYGIDGGLFDVPWWYRGEFTLPLNATRGSTVVLRFHGINYRADIWVNGVSVASNASTVGAFRHFTIDVSTLVVVPGGRSAIAVLVSRPHDLAIDPLTTDLGITFVDWSPQPPDQSMGLWHSVDVRILPAAVSLRYPFVTTVLRQRPVAAGAPAPADLSVGVELTNWGAAPASGVLSGALFREGGGPLPWAAFAQPFTLPGGATALVAFNATSFPQLRLENALLWWPWQMGPPTLHTLTFNVTLAGGALSDGLAARAGLRQSTAALDASGHLQYAINGFPLLIRGAGWSPDEFLRDGSPAGAAWTASALAYTRDMGLNTIRLEGKSEPDGFYTAADEAGLLVMPGWCCCDAWQHWELWGPEQHNVSVESQSTQARRLRIHPSVFTFFISSDQMPPPAVEAGFRDALSAQLWAAPIVSAASDRNSTLSGPTGVKMSGPYSWVPPNYWLTDPGQVGGAFGFLTEGGPGENPLQFESLSLVVPPADLWPPRPDDCWGHCGRLTGNFGSLKRFLGPLSERFGQAADVRTLLFLSHAQAYEGHRAMFEAYGRNKASAGPGVPRPHGAATGVIQWMLNSPWPDNIWHLFDAFLNPGPAYFATKQACEPLHVMYAYDDARAYAVNSLFAPVTGPLWGEAALFTGNGTVFATAAGGLPDGLPGDGAAPLFALPTPDAVRAVLGPRRTYFVGLTLYYGSSNASGAVASRGTYWLSTSPDVLDWPGSTWYNTPCSAYADYGDLRALPPAPLTVTVSPAAAAAAAETGATLAGSPTLVATVNVTNTAAAAVALLVHLRLVDAASVDVWPVLWSDNYFSLRPGEAREGLSAVYDARVGPAIRVIAETFNGVVQPPA